MSADDVDTEPDIDAGETPRGQDSEETILGQQELNKVNPKSYKMKEEQLSSRNDNALYPDAQ